MRKEDLWVHSSITLPAVLLPEWRTCIFGPSLGPIPCTDSEAWLEHVLRPVKRRKEASPRRKAVSTHQLQLRFSVQLSFVKIV